MSSTPSPTGPGPAAGVPTCYRHPDRETYISCQRCSRPICPECMRDAAVGFQCPTCVKEGAAATRQGRTAYGGLRPGNPGLTTSVLIGINVVVWVLIQATGGAASRLVDVLSLHALGVCPPTYRPMPNGPMCEASLPNAQWVPGLADGALWQVLSSTFTHVAWWHLGFNMLALYVLGPQLETVLGRSRFLALYLLSGVGASVLVFWLADPFSRTLGASGAIFGMLAAMLVIAYKVRANTQQVLTDVFVAFLITFIARGYLSWQGHLGGFLAGLAVTAVLVYAPRGPSRTRTQVAGLTAIGVALVVALVVRSLSLS